METLTREEALVAFEEEYNFHSHRSYTNTVLDEISACESLEERQSILETCTDYLVEEDGRLMPKISSVAYASIADMDGVFYVANVKHTVDGTKVRFETQDVQTRASTLMDEIDYVCPITDAATTRNATERKYTDNRYESGKYKVFARTNIMRVAVAKVINGQNLIASKFYCQVHVSGQKKKSIIGWSSYKDTFHVDNLHYEVLIGRHVFKPYKYQNSNLSSSDGNVYNHYASDPIGPEENDFVALDAMPMPTAFNCIVHRARSNSIGNCGVLTHNLGGGCNTMPDFVPRLTACK